MASNPKDHHAIWLAAHPYVDAEWLRAKIQEGFHIHHVDGDHCNDAPENMLLIFGPDHTRLHTLERRLEKLEQALNVD